MFTSFWNLANFFEFVGFVGFSKLFNLVIAARPTESCAASRLRNPLGHVYYALTNINKWLIEMLGSAIVVIIG